MHDFGPHPRRLSPPIRRLCALIGESLSVHLDRIILYEKVHARQLVSVQLEHEKSPIVAQPKDLLALFRADFGALCVGRDQKVRRVLLVLSDIQCG